MTSWRYVSYIRRSPQTILFCYKDKDIQLQDIYKIARTVQNMLKVTNCFHQRAKYVQGGWGGGGCTAVGRSRVLWTRRQFGIRILNGLIVLMLEVITNLVMCSGRNFNTEEGSYI